MLISKKKSRNSTPETIDMIRNMKGPLLVEALPYDGPITKDIMEILTTIIILVPGVILAVIVLLQNDDVNLKKVVIESKPFPTNVYHNKSIDNPKYIQLMQAKCLLDMDAVERLVDDRVQKAIMLYNADKTGMIDYALESAGAVLISTPETKTYPMARVHEMFATILFTIAPKANIILQPSTQPGDCFPFTGFPGRFRIELLRRVEVTAVTIEHAAFSIINDLRSAPKNFVIHGLNSSTAKDGEVLGQFKFNIDDEDSLQTFKITKKKAYKFVEIEIISNHGHPNYTCVYRVRVHGQPSELIN